MRSPGSNSRITVAWHLKQFMCWPGQMCTRNWRVHRYAFGGPADLPVIHEDTAGCDIHCRTERATDSAR